MNTPALWKTALPCLDGGWLFKGSSPGWTAADLSKNQLFSDLYLLCACCITIAYTLGVFTNTRRALHTKK